MGWLDLGIDMRFTLLALVLSFGCCSGDTDQRDVFAMNSLFVALGTPQQLSGWQAQDGDPCGTNWQGVECVYSNITALKLDNANLGGELGEYLGFFSSVISIDLRDNRIGGPIPTSLPTTIRNLYLSGNLLTGPIPDTLDTLSQLTDLSLSENNLTGEIPDSFNSLGLLVNLELSDNKLSGPLPPSMGKLSSLITFNMQNNQITGTLDVLQGLPMLANLDVENNLLSGPIPPNLIALPNFRSSGNPFNTTIIPSPPAISPLPSSPEPSPGPAILPSKPSTGPSEPDTNPSKATFFTAKRVIWIAFAGVAIFVVIAIIMVLFMSKSCKWLQPTERLGKSPQSQTSPVDGSGEGIKYKETLLRQNNHLEQAPKTLLVSKEKRKRTEEKIEQDIEKAVVPAPRLTEDHASLKSGIEIDTKLPKLPPVPPPVALKSSASTLSNKNISNAIKCFNIAELQQYTRSFSQGNLIGRGSLGSVYRAKLPEGKAFAVKKLNNAVRSDDEFLELISVLSKWKHPNVVELVGYCAEYDQYLLAFEYYRNGTLYDALHLDDEIHSKLSWNHRMRIALGAAKALEYLHETCQPPVTHHNFKSINLLLDDKLSISVSDCGLSLVMSQEVQNQLSLTLSANGYGAPELEAGSYTLKSDIYSFGVVMLELLTARKPYDRSRPRGEQFLVSWALSQLHDIDSLSRMVDPYLNDAYPSKSLSRFADIISLCLQPEPEFRPFMSEIVENIIHLVQG